MQPACSGSAAQGLRRSLARKVGWHGSGSCVDSSLCLQSGPHSAAPWSGGLPGGGSTACLAGDF